MNSDFEMYDVTSKNKVRKLKKFNKYNDDKKNKNKMKNINSREKDSRYAFKNRRIVNNYWKVFNNIQSTPTQARWSWESGFDFDLEENNEVICFSCRRSEYSEEIDLLRYEYDFMEFKVHREIAEFYKNSKDIMKDFISCNIKENEEELNKIEDYLHLIDKALMETEYVNYLQNKAEIFGEKELLEKSCNIIYDLGSVYVFVTKDSAHIRNWIYECELLDFKIKLLENKKKIKEILTRIYVSSSVALALLIN
jgi:hypothetical protein